MRFGSICSLVLIGMLSCRKTEPAPELPLFRNYKPTRILQEPDSLSAYAVIEIPAGTATTQVIDTSGELQGMSEGTFDFLPFPGNYGFIAGCAQRDTVTGNLTPLPVLVLMPSLAAESIISIRPVATLALRKGGVPHPIVIAVPSDTTLRSVRLESFADLITEYDATRNILQQWFMNYLGREAFALTGWKDEHYTRQLIRDWKITQ